ncbi:MAG TPA: hypothetical protein PLL80_00820 [Candidatus Pacearchaeota archaeon]|nr:hypothetical protein [Candidatus Pacearchaeota archaeon]HOK94070.1 hypothetical protein [Candidatus Pacearchaeota archaeon]HPO75141.1 hypothetical protein [Candidatus Pacearchaeota archaeon]
MPYSQILYIDPPDDLNKVREEIRKAQREKVILVLPEENKNLKNIENLTILKKEAQSLNKRLAIFSTDPKYKKLAEDCGIEIEESLIGDGFSAESELSFRPKVSDILPKSQPPLEEKNKTIKKIEVGTPLNVPQAENTSEKKASPRKRSWLKPVLYTLLFFAIGGGIFYSLNYLPRANITLVPASEEIEFSGEFTIKNNAQFNLKEKIIPGELIEKKQDIEKSFLATKTEDKNAKAKGKIIIYNEDSSPHRFVPNTRFKSEDGKVFRSEDWINIPAGSKNNPSKVEVEVIAEEAGEEYNIGPTNFTIPGLGEGTDLYKLIYAKSTEPMNGGFVGQTKVVSQEDLDKAKAEMKTLIDNTGEELKNEILKEVSPSLQQVLKDLIVVEKGEITFDKKAGDIGETFKGKATVTAKVLSFNEDDVQEIVANIISSKVKDGVEFEEVVSSQEINYEILNNNINEGVIDLAFSGKEKIAWKITADQIKKEVAGLDENGFQKYIKENMKGKIMDGEAVLWPFWVNKIPQREDRIFIEIKYQ